MKKISMHDMIAAAKDIVEQAPDKYRCYEITRLLKSKLSQGGIRVDIKDGYARYPVLEFLSALRKGECRLFFDKNEDFSEIVRAARYASRIANKKALEKNLEWQIGIRHSWCILPEEKFLIDCHRWIDLSESSDLFPALQEFPILSKIRIRRFVRVVPFKKVPSYFAYSYQNVVYMENAVQIKNKICYPNKNHSTRLRCLG